MKELEKAFNPIQRLDRLLTKDVKWRSGHSVFGILFLLLCFAEIYRFSQAPLVDDSSRLSVAILINLIATIQMFATLMSRKFSPRLRYLGDRTSLFVRLAAWNFAFSGLMISFYTLPASYWKRSYDTEKSVSFAYWIGTSVYAAGTLISTLSSIIDIARGRILKGAVSAFTTSTGLLLFLPVMHLLIGTESLEEYYEKYPVSEAVYIVALLSTTINSYDTFWAGLEASSKISSATYHLIAILDWAVIYTLSVVWFLSNLSHDWRVGAAFFTYSFGLFGMSFLFEKVTLKRGRGIGKYD